MKEKRFYLIYQITNNVNRKIYIGKHETNNLDDDYFGSGKHLINAQNKYGLENFTKTILFYCQSREEMNLLEKCVVTPEFCQREDVYNINEGGDGGRDYVNSTSGLLGNNGWRRNKTPEENHQICVKGGIMHQQKIKKLSEEYLKYCQKKSLAIKKWYKYNPNYFVGKNNPMFNHQYTQETLDKLSSSKQGKKNNRYGSKWYYDPKTFESHSFLPDENVPEEWKLGRKMKKKKI